ncbi:MAG: guanylate kinase [Lachnospiraceae bacterium]|mgnify:CR=1 FL=1|nr:guanylate kinase [Lachnospiraceae bacterium]MDE7020995.1 guanylate kinase [Lachnospiraceae bacterium]
MKHKGILIVVSGFSGAGKGTLMKKLVQEYDNYALSISATTRAPRAGEEDGREYFFITKEAFEQKIAENGLIEYARYCENYYGTPRDYVEKQLEAGRDVILEIEIQGALKIRKQFPTALLLFVMPPNVEELKHRLTGRGTETPEVIDRRLARAAEEAEGIEEYDYIVVNDDLETCVEQLHEIILAAHNTPFRNEEFIEKIRKELDVLVKGEK